VTPTPARMTHGAVAPTPARMTTARQRRLQLIQPTDVTKGFAAAVAEAWRQHRLEVIAVVGSTLVMTSKLWTVGDKWLTVPGLIVIVIAGIAVAEALGGSRTDAAAYGDEALSAAATLFKITMLLAAVYLAWRMQRGHRARRVPPWVRRRRR
jgi:hypothetical protein